MKNKYTKEELEEQIGWMRMSQNDIMNIEDPAKRSLYLKKYRQFMHQMSPLFTKLGITDEEVKHYQLSFDDDVKAADIFRKMHQIKQDKNKSNSKKK